MTEDSLQFAQMPGGSRLWVGTPGLWGYVAISMIIHILIFSFLSQYHSRQPVMQMPPILVSIVPPAIISPDSKVPDAIDSTDGPESVLPLKPEQSPPPLEPDTDALKPEGISPDISDRRAIFDSEIIAQRALDPIKDGSETGITFNPSDIMLRGYMGLLKERVENAWLYPYQAAKDGVFGDLRILFVIKRNGTLGDVHVTRTSGHVVLDNAAMKALRDAEPFWPLPEGYEQEALTVHGRFVYSLSGRYIR